MGEIITGLVMLLAVWALLRWRADAVQSTAFATFIGNEKNTELTGEYFFLYTAPAGALTPAILDNNFGGGGLTELTVLQQTGYARQIVAAGTVTNPAAGEALITFPSVTFGFTGAGTGAAILGWGIASGAVIGAGNVAWAQAITSYTPPVGIASTFTVGPLTITDTAV